MNIKTLLAALVGAVFLAILPAHAQG